MITKEREEATEKMVEIVEKRAREKQDKLIMTMIPGIRRKYIGDEKDNDTNSENK